MVTRVLIADDDPRITEIHQHYVSKFEGFEVIGLSNTLEDTKLQIEVMEPQLLLLDIYFPDGSGIELLKEIVTDEKALDDEVLGILKLFNVKEDSFWIECAEKD